MVKNANFYFNLANLILLLVSCCALIYSQRLLNESKQAYIETLKKEQEIKQALIIMEIQNDMIKESISDINKIIPKEIHYHKHLKIQYK